MKRLILVITLVLVAAVGYRTYGSPTTGTGTLTLPGPAPNEGQQAPTFTADRYEGGTFTLSNQGTYVLTFWSTLSQGSMEARPEFARLAREFRGSGVQFAAVYLNSVPKDEDQAPYIILQDKAGNLSSMYNVNRVPRLFLISNGRIVLVQNGFYPENTKHLEAALTETLRDER